MRMDTERMCPGEMHLLCLCLILSVMFLVTCLGLTQDLAADDSTKDIHLQVLLGATRYSDLSFESQGMTDSSLEATSEISLMPTLGICAGMPFLKGPVNLGLEGGALFGWRTDHVTAFSQGGGTVRLYIDNKLYLLDLFLGPYVSTNLGQGARIYAGAGPLLMAGQYEKSSEEKVSESETIRDGKTSMVSGAGMYARTGIEFMFEDGSMMGLCVRGFKSKLDFEDMPEDYDVKGLQFMITFSAKP